MQNTPTTNQRKTSDGYWLNEIYCGDCLEVMRTLPDKSFGLVITSPPYNLANSSGNFWKDQRGSRWDKARLATDGYTSHNDAMPISEYVAWQQECLQEMMRLLKDDGAIFYNHKWRVQNGLIDDKREIVREFPVRQIIIWQRAGGINFNDSFFVPTYEVIYLIAKPKFKLKPGANGHGDVWRINQARNNPHPAPFPVELAHRIIDSTDADPILDPFLGSGTTAVAAQSLGKEWLGIEVSPEYCEMAEKRIKQTGGLGTMFTPELF